MNKQFSEFLDINLIWGHSIATLTMQTRAMQIIQVILRLLQNTINAFLSALQMVQCLISHLCGGEMKDIPYIGPLWYTKETRKTRGTAFKRMIGPAFLWFLTVKGCWCWASEGTLQFDKHLIKPVLTQGCFHRLIHFS